MCLFLQLVFSVGIGTGITKLAFPIHFPVSAHLGFLLEGVLLLELESLLRILEVLLLALSGCLAKVFLSPIMWLV